MRLLMLLLVAGPAHAGTAGLSPTMFGWRTSARHAVRPAVQAWVVHTARPWSLTGEVLASRYRTGNPWYESDAVHLQLAPIVSWAAGTHETSFHAGLGPALVVRTGTAGDPGQPVGFTRLDVGARARLALDGPLTGPLGWTWHTGTTVGTSGIAYDAGLGLGVRW